MKFGLNWLQNEEILKTVICSTKSKTEHIKQSSLRCVSITRGDDGEVDQSGKSLWSSYPIDYVRNRGAFSAENGNKNKHKLLSLDWLGWWERTQREDIAEDED